MSKQAPIVRMAIAYDFDETLAVHNMLAHAVPTLNIDRNEFEQAMQDLPKQYKSDDLLVCMHLFVEYAKKAGMPLSKESLRAFGAYMEPFPGLPEWFTRMNAYAAERDIQLEHYVISSNMREILEGTPIAPYFTRIFGSAFIYDENGHACWPALVVDYTGKTQFLFRISKGCPEEYDNGGVNARVAPEERAVPFANIIYIGDGETDVPCMEVTRDKGGHAFALYNPERAVSVTRAESLAAENRVDAALPADYRSGSRLDNAIKAVVDKVAAEARLRQA